MKRDRFGRPVDSAAYVAELLASAAAGMTQEELQEWREQRAKEGR